MKKLNTLKYLLGAVLLGATITACDKFEDDVPPARMTGLSLNDDFYSTIKNQRVLLNVLDNDTIGSTATLQFTQPQQGTLQTDSVGTMYYYPGPNFVGTDAFTYKACLDNNCATANVTINVIQDSTTTGCTVRAFDDIRHIKQNHDDTINVTMNDNLCGIVPNPNNTTVTIISGPQNGHASVQSFDNKIYYSPKLNYSGQDELTYRITNSKGTSTARVLFSIQPGPTVCYVSAKTDSAYINRVLGTIDTVSTIIVANDILCPNAGPVTVTLQGQTQKQTQYGLFQVVGTGTNTRLIYTTTAGKNFTDFVLYNLCQGNNCSSAYVYVHVK